MALGSIFAGNLFFASAMICSLVLFLRGAKAIETTLAAIFGVLLALRFSVHADHFYVYVMVWLAWWAVGGFLTTFGGTYIRRKEFRERVRLLRNMALGPLAIAITTTFLMWSARLLPVTLDRYLYAFDASLGYPPGFATASFLLRREWLNQLTGIAYVNLPIAMLVVYLGLDRRDSLKAAMSIRLFMAIGVAGYFAYHLFPAAGAPFVFRGDFPFHPLTVASLPAMPIQVAFAPRNCMPSLHTAWTLAVLWAARDLSRTYRVALAAAAVPILVYTLACHYLADMIAAVPFFVAVYAAVYGLAGLRLKWKHPAWRSACWLSTTCFLLWLAALRFGTAVFLSTPAIGWSAGLITVAACWYFIRKPGSASTASAEHRHAVGGLATARDFPQLGSA